MKKTAIILFVVLVASMFALSSCDILAKIPVIGDLINKPCTEHVDADKDYVCDKCGEKLEHDDPTVCDKHVDADGDLACDKCGEKLEPSTPPVCDEHVDADGNLVCDNCGAELEPSAPPVCENHVDTDGDFKCDVCDYVMFEQVEYSLNVGDLDAGVRSSDEINGKFTILSGTEIRNRTKSYEGVEYTKSVKLGSSGSTIKVAVPGTGKLRFIVQNGSSGAAVQYVKVTNPEGTASEIEIPGTDGGSPLYMVELDVTEGDWLIQRVSGTVDVYYLELDCVVAVAPENGFELVSGGKTQYLTGETLDTTGLQLNATFENGKTDSLDLSLVNIDASQVDMTKSGVYSITVTYKEYEPVVYQVSVYAPESITLGFDAIEKIANSGAGNGVYFNHSFKELYFVGEELDTRGLSVIVVAKCGDDSLEFRVDDYKIEGFDSETYGEKILTISSFGVSATAVVHVTDSVPAPDDNGEILVLVDPNYLGLRGAKSGVYYVVSTIQQGLDFLAKADAATPKVLNIAPGYYREKLEITIPNLTIIGCGDTSEDVVIEWDSLYGLVDAGGFTHTTDSTQTVAIRENAVNCVIEGVTISNYWNTQERMDEAGLAIERGLALLVQSDRFIMKDSRLLGIQDTLELFTGRQYFENVFISGYTDFIFGTNNTTYFKNCTIHVIDTGKDDSGTAGYLTAFKGSNKGASDSIVYGAIFDGCKFTADEGVMEGKTAIGRTWGAYAAVAIINSELGEHISIDGYDKAENKNKRYISMNGIHPTDETVQFVEYNNTGAGAITEAVAGMRFLTDEEAKLYADFATIFGKINGNVSYLDPWDPSSDEIQVDDRDYYYFNGGSSATGNSHTFDITTTIGSGTTLEWDGLLISAENGKVAWNSNANSLNMKTGAFIKFTVPAGATVTVETYPNYNYFTLNGVGTASANMLSQYYAEETEVILLSTGDLYIYSIIIDPNSEAPVAPTLSEIKVSGFNTNYVVGDEISLEGVVVKGIYSDNSVREVAYEVDASAVVNTAAGEYAVIFSFEGKTVTATVTYEDPNAGPEITKNTVLDFTTVEGLEAVQNNPKVTINGSVRHNGAEIQIKGTISFKVKAGTVVSVLPYANTSYASFKIYAEGKDDGIVYNESHAVMFFEDCTVVYEGLENNYLCKISIECPLSEGKYVFGGSTEEGDVTGILESIPGMSVSGTCKNHSGGAQLGSDSQIIFIAPALATVTVQGFDTNYGQLLVLVDGVPVEMNANAQYVFTAPYASTIIIEAINVGTEEEPAYNKSYITYIQIDVPVFIEENTEITFGSEGNYKDSVVDFSGITIGDNGGSNSQIKNGSFSFAVRKGAIVIVHGYSGYTSYNLSDGDLVWEGITDEYYTYEAWSDCAITISHTTGNNYFYSISIVYPVVYEENTTIDLSATGANIQKTTGMYEGLEIDATTGKFADNGSGWVQVNAGTVIKLNVLDGAEVSVSAYSSADNFEIDITDGVCKITCNANDYLNAITVKYAVIYDETVTIDLSATGASIQGSVGAYEGLTVDATNGKFADNGGGWVQVNNGTIITLNVADGATITVSAYSSADNFAIAVADGVCTITCTGNDYLNGITVTY
ncbi:MAG: bacterial Ig-like domain-containing protein [Clostridia bacterium]|nr:bacterial Ig-like domain-containing protein [Clostridia bacterium]